MIEHCYVTVMVRPRDSGEAFRSHRVLIQEGCGMARAELEHRAAYHLIAQGFEPLKVVRIQKVTAAQLAARKAASIPSPCGACRNGEGSAKG